MFESSCIKTFLGWCRLVRWPAAAARGSTVARSAASCVRAGWVSVVVKDCFRHRLFDRYHRVWTRCEEWNNDVQYSREEVYEQRQVSSKSYSEREFEVKMLFAFQFNFNFNYSPFVTVVIWTSLPLFFEYSEVKTWLNNIFFLSNNELGKKSKTSSYKD